MERLLLFADAGQRFAFDLAQVAEVLEPPPLYPVPRAGEAVAGVTSCHGELVLVADLGPLLGNGPAQPDGRTIVLDRHVGALGLRVASVTGIVPAAQVLEQRPDTDELTVAMLQLADGDVRLLDPARLLLRVARSLTSAPA